MKTLKIALCAAAMIGAVAVLSAKDKDTDMDDMKDMKGMKMESKDKAAETVTLSGEVLDMDCYMNEGASGKDHASCAVKCLGDGAPVGLLTADGKAYFLTANESKGKEKYYQQVRDLGSQQVKITGVIQNRAGAMCLRIDNLEKLEKP